MNYETLTHWYKEGDYYFLSDNTELRTIRPWRRSSDWVGKSWYGWFVGLGQNRDSDALTRSNFEVFLKALRELPEIYVDDSENDKDWVETNSVFVVRESHWACGWIEWVAIHPSNEAALKLADEMMCSLEDYPALSDDHWSELESEEINDYWERESLHDRIQICREAGESIFAARRDYPTEKVFYHLKDNWY